MKIDRRLNIVMRVDGGDSEYVIHSTPISEIVFRSHWKLFRKVSDDISSGEWDTGIALAKMILLDVAKNTQQDAAGRELLSAITAQTFAIINGASVLISNEAVPEDVREEALNRLVFFTVRSPFIPARTMEMWRSAISTMWNAEFTPLDCTVYQNSLTTSTTDGNTGGIQIQSSPV